VPVQDVYTITGIGTVPVGRVETGVMTPNTKVIFEPSHVNGVVKSIEMHHEQMAKAEPGDNIGFNVGGVAKTFTAQIIVLNHPSVITVGYTPVFHVHTAQVACQFVEIIQASRAGKPLTDLSFLKNGDNAVVKLKPMKPLVIEPAKDFPPLGRFAIRDMGQTVAAGVCTAVERAN
ncbi:MAG: elongation factor 1-alpha, partial [Candidatus Methanomethylophilus sp.]|nr:elongation factor 1-alpha [Methanomethylophilus sp.]